MFPLPDRALGPVSLRRYLDDLDAPDRTLAVLRRDADDPTRRMLAGLFAGQDVTVTDRNLPDVLTRLADTRFSLRGSRSRTRRRSS